MTRSMFLAGVLLLAGSASAAEMVSNIPANEEVTEETGAPYGKPYVDLTSCSLDSKAVTNAQLQVPDQDRGYKVEVASGCMTSEKVWPTKVDETYRR